MDGNEKLYGIRLKPAVYTRLIEFLNLPENIGLRQSEVIDKLLIATDVLTNIRNQVAPSAPRSEQQPPAPAKFPILSTPAPPKRPSRLSANNVEREPDRRVVTFGREKPESDEEENNNDDDDVIEEEIINGDDFMEMEEEDEESIQPEVTSNAAVPTTSPSKYMSMTSDYYAEAKERLAAKFKKHPTRSAVLPRPSVATNQGKQNFDPKSKLIRKRGHPQRPWTTNIRRFLYDVLQRRRRDGNLFCHECNRLLRVRNNLLGKILDHVCLHIGKPIMYGCRLCLHKMPTENQARIHVKNEHGRINDFEDLTDSYFDEISERITSCFDQDPVEKPVAGARRLVIVQKKRLTRTEIALKQEKLINQNPFRRFIFQIVEKWEKEIALYCRHCDHWVRIGSRGALAKIQAVLKHVCDHFNILIYLCSICGDRTSTQNQMLHHIQKIHEAESRGNYLESIDDYETDLRKMITTCFDWEDGTYPPLLTSDSPFWMKKLKKGSMETPVKPGEEPPIETIKKKSCQQLASKYVHDLIKKYTDSETYEMKCQQCNQAIQVKDANLKGKYRPERIFFHVLIHTNSAPYACRLCDATTNRTDLMRRHVSNYHKEILPGDYIDNTELIKEEIFETIKKCFDLNHGETMETTTSAENIQQSINSVIQQAISVVID